MLASTQMVLEICNSMNNDFDKETLSLKIPSFFECFKAQEATFDIVTSPTLRPLQLMYNYNKVTKKIAYVFVNTGCLN